MTENRHEQLVLTDETLNTHFAEAYRALRANISFSSIDRPVKTILVTSAAPREGKTTTVINLGIILAQAGPRVLIVDSDFRRPSLHHIFGFLPNGSLQPDRREFSPRRCPAAERIRPCIPGAGRDRATQSQRIDQLAANEIGDRRAGGGSRLRPDR
jgi:Mrp family chromosome partitioning ATPase